MKDSWSSPLEERLEVVLRKHVGLRFCAACLSRELRVSLDEARNAVWALQARPGFQMRGGKCLGCRISRRVIWAVGGEAGLDETSLNARVVRSLRASAGTSVCDGCLALTADLSLDDTRRALANVQQWLGLDRKTGRCSECGRSTEVTTASVSERDSARKDLAGVPGGGSHYRGWRIELLSYRARSGWRPFVLVKSPLGAVVPDAPSVLRPLFPLKILADEQALRAAKEWIDKRSE